LVEIYPRFGRKHYPNIKGTLFFKGLKSS